MNGCTRLRERNTDCREQNGSSEKIHFAKKVTIVIFFFIIPQAKPNKNGYNENIESAKRFAQKQNLQDI